MDEQEKPKSLGEALLRFQQLALKITKDQKADTAPGKYRYLSLEKLLEEVLPHLSELDLVWSSSPTTLEDGQTPALAYRLDFVGDGDRDQVVGKMPLMLRGGTPQDQGAAISYARRYSMLAVLNLAPDVDEDGAISTPQRGGQKGVKRITKAKATQIVEKAEAVGMMDKLQLAANWEHKDDVGPCTNKAQSITQMQKLNATEAEAVIRWLEKKAQEALS